jgi:hypothetical protein
MTTSSQELFRSAKSSTESFQQALQELSLPSSASAEKARSTSVKVLDLNLGLLDYINHNGSEQLISSEKLVEYVNLIGNLTDDLAKLHDPEQRAAWLEKVAVILCKSAHLHASRDGHTRNVVESSRTVEVDRTSNCLPPDDDVLACIAEDHFLYEGEGSIVCDVPDDINPAIVSTDKYKPPS